MQQELLTRRELCSGRYPYSSVTVRTAVSGIDGETVMSDLFPVNRGVVQGDITSPMYFILALALIIRTHDTRTDKGVEMCGRVIHDS